MTFDDIEVKDDGVWISKSELEKHFEEYRRLGYMNHGDFTMTGNETLQMRSIQYHAKADVFMNLLQIIEDNKNCD